MAALRASTLVPIGHSDRSLLMIIDMLFLLGGLGLFAFAGLSVAAADRL
jgi:hypothetical protein